MPKFYCNPDHRAQCLQSIDEDVFMRIYQQELLAMANCKAGRDLLCIDDLGLPIVGIAKNYVRYYLGQTPDDRPEFVSAFRIGAKYANVIRYRWDAFCSYMRYFQANSGLEHLPISPLAKYCRSICATTTTVYPDPNVESTTVDGRSQKDDSTDWAVSHDALTGSAASDTENAQYITVYKDAGSPNPGYQITRFFDLYDTSSITDTDTISAATRALYITSVSDQDDDAQGYVSTYATTPASNTAITTADYDQIGTTVQSDNLDLSSISTGAFNTWTLNAAGLASIDKTGVTKFGGREGHDAENSVITGVGAKENSIAFRTADYTGTTSDPVLTVTHAAAATSTAYRLLILGVG